MSNLLYSTQSVLSIKPFVYHVTTLENFKNWLASGIWQLASGNWQLAGTDWRQEELLNLYTFIPLRGATKKKAWEKCRIGGRGGTQWATGEITFGAHFNLRGGCQRVRERKREGRVEGREVRAVWQSATISGKCVFILGHFALIESELCPHSIRWHPQRPALKWFLIIFLNL